MERTELKMFQSLNSQMDRVGVVSLFWGKEGWTSTTTFGLDGGGRS